MSRVPAVRDIVLIIYSVTWGIAVTISMLRTGTVPPELLAALGVGVGAILGVFRLDDRASHDPPPRSRDAEETRP